MEDGEILISRVRHKYRYPANFMLVATMNPCPCGFYGSDGNRCTCSSHAISRYLSHLSGPILDRIDLQIFMKPVTTCELTGISSNAASPPTECSATIAARVLKAREIQYHRFTNEQFCTNSRIPSSQLEHFCKIGSNERKFMESIVNKLGLAARSYARLLKISRTIADLDGEDFISLAHISKALQFRNLNSFLMR